MNKYIFRIISCAVVLFAVTFGSYATTRLGETKNYKICPGDKIKIDARETMVFSDTILFDTLVLATLPEPDSVINQYVVNVYPTFDKTEYRTLETGQIIEWCDTTIDKAGTYERRFQSSHGCDSIHRLILTEYVPGTYPETIDTTAVICPGTTITWHGRTFGTTGIHEFPGTRENGDLLVYRLNLTVKELQYLTRTFTLCDNESVVFNGKTYVNAGEYYDQYTCDTLYQITIVKYPGQLHVQNAKLDATHPYYWLYYKDGTTHTDTLTDAGVYEYTTLNPETGCNDTWRLVLTKDETSYRFDTAAIVCENDYFEWRGKKNLNRQGVGTTTDYFDYYKTQTGYDSIYHLSLRVQPVLRTTRTIPFCNTTVWNGKTYTESKTIVDTLTSIQYNCDSIVTVFLAKGIPFHHHDTVTILPGETLEWRGQTIDHDGLYEDKYVSRSGCDSIYTLGVGLKEAAPVTNMRTWRVNICEGESYEWNDAQYFNPGTYVDTVFINGTQEIDSLNILILTVNPKYNLRERITFHTFPGTYRGYQFTTPGEEHVFQYTTITGCDSTITVIAEQEVTRFEETAMICPGETYIWDWDGLTYRESGRYVKTIPDINGNDSVEHILNLTVKYIPDTYISKTICKGGSYTFGDRVLTQSGNYDFTFHETGCDSVVHLALNVLSNDTNIFVHQMNDGESYVWNGSTYEKTGTYYHYATNRFGCDSINVLVLTISRIDTIEAQLTVCPNELPFVWNSITANQTGHFYKSTKQPNGDYVFYHLDLTVREIAQVDTTFSMCADGSISFNGKTYTEAGHYRDYLNCDTLVNIHIVKYPQQVYVTNASITDEHGYTWTYWNNGTPDTATFNTPGTYEFESPNATTGCSEIWRLILTKDETEYHFVETLSICEGDDFSWRGLTNLSRQGIGQTSHYFDRYETRAGKDSIYELVLTVTPIERTVRSITFCGSIEWNGQTYTNSTVVYDTTTTAEGCYSIERVNLDKAVPFYSYETRDLPQGRILNWHGQNITTDGTYYDRQTTVQGCDSIYEIKVTIIPADPSSNQYAEELSACEGDTILWRGKEIWRGGTYVDTVYKAGTENIDSIFTLTFTVWPAPKDTIYQHLYTCGSGASIRYQGVDYWEDAVIISNLPTIHGCDSIVKVFLHFNTALLLTDTVEIADTRLPYTWTYRLGGLTRDTVLTTAGTYSHVEPAEGSCTNREELTLIVYPTYLFQLDTTICETDLPFHWLTGPADHATDNLRHPVGETKQYEYRYNSVHNTDSIYRLNLTIAPAPRSIEQYTVCQGNIVTINGKQYGRYDMPADCMYRDTAFHRHSNEVCDSIIYYEIYVSSVKKHYETRILHYDDEPIEWNGYTITEGGLYDFTTPNIGMAGCDSISTLHVVKEMREFVNICVLDGPFTWRGKDYQTAGLWTDTVFDNSGDISEYHTLQLTIDVPTDTTIYLRGCVTAGEEPKGVTWNGQTYFKDTTFRDVLACDQQFTVHIKIDTAYTIEVVDTICESSLPYILGTQNPDTIWSECVRFPHTDITACGCDSTVYLTLRIIPELTKNDSTFVCEDFFMEGGKVTLGNLTDPWFEYRENGRFSGTWQGKWHGVEYTEDTIVYNCDSTYFHHIIVRPHQASIPEKTYSLCKGDSVQLFWPHNTIWIKTPGVYYDTIPTTSGWTDTKHNTTVHNDLAYACDSITKWTVVYADTLHVDRYAHIREGETYIWNDSILSTTGVYDSIGYALDMDSAHHYCKAVYSMHLFVEPVYKLKDTTEICHRANREYTYTFSDGHEITFRTPASDTSIIQLKDSVKHLSYDFYDHFYDLVVYYKQEYYTQITDTLCYGDSIQFDQHNFNIENNTTHERYLKEPGIYIDTLPALNGCDSIIELRLIVRDRVPVHQQTLHVPDSILPYPWHHTWKDENGTLIDSTRWIIASGDYECVMKTTYGCDSIDRLTLVAHHNYTFLDTVSLCQDQTPYTWYGPDNTVFKNDIYDSGEYIRHLRTQDGYADSTYILRVNVAPIVYSLRYDTICYGDSLQFGLTKHNQPRFLHRTGVYYDTLTSVRYGCDSIIELRLNVYANHVNKYTRHITRTELPLMWEHIPEGTTVPVSTTPIYAEGIYGFNFKSVHGCDSIDSLTVIVHDDYLYRDSVTICQSETPYVWQGTDGTIYKNDIYQSDEYIIRLRKQDGHSDSTIIRKVTVLPVTYSLRYDTLCYGDSLQFGLTKHNRPRFLLQSGVYYDTLRSIQHGCDSIIELRLNVFPHLDKYHAQVDITDKQLPYKWYHRYAGSSEIIDSTVINASGTFEYIFKTKHGCDSIDHLTVNIHTNYYFRDSIAICESETPYTWNGPDNTIFKNDIYDSGEYTRHLRTADGYADSIYTRIITVLPVRHVTIHDSICADESKENFYSFNGQKLTQSGVYQYTTTAKNGCDSITTLYLTVNHPYHNYIERHIIQGQSVTVLGHTFSRDTLHTIKGLTPNGCDSVIDIRVIVHPMVDTTVVVCSNSLPYQWVNKWNGQVTPLYAAGLYRNDTTYVNGKRVFYGLKLIVNDPVYVAIHDSICADESKENFYSFNGQKLTQSGVYQYTTTAKNGCDSITTLYLTVNHPYHNYIERHIIQGQSVTVLGHTFSQDTLHTIKGLTPNGCDSVIDIRVIVHPMVDTTVVVCSNSLPYQWVNKWSGQVTPLYAAGLYRNDTTYVNGKRMFYGLKLVVNEPVDTTINRTICEGDEYVFNGQSLKQQGQYVFRLTSQNGCDSIVTVILTVHTPKVQTDYKKIFEGESVEFYGETHTQSGVYVHKEPNGYGCDDTHQLVLTVLQPFKVDTTAYVCENDMPFVWHGLTFEEEGDYDVPTAWTDSSRVVTTLHLFINPVPRAERIVDLCQSNTFVYKGKNYTQSGVFYDTIPTTLGCDSIIKYIIRVHPTFDRWDTVHISDKQSYQFGGRTLTIAGDYEFSGTTKYGCDSLHHLHLVVHPSYYFKDSTFMCQPDTLFWHGKVITESGIYRDEQLTKYYGFDSIYEIKVQVYPSYYMFEQYTIDEGDSITIHGIPITRLDSIYTDTLKTIYGCDSIYQIAVNSKRMMELNRSAEICEGSYYELGDKRFTKTGTYTVMDKAQGIIYHLTLTVHPKSLVKKQIVITDEDLPYIYEGQFYTPDVPIWDNTRKEWDEASKSTVYTDTFYNQFGCDSLVRLEFLVTTRYSEWDQIPLCSGETIIIDRDTITKAGFYTFVRRSEESKRLDSLYRVEVYEAPSFEMPPVKMTICEGDSALFQGKYFKYEGEYKVILKTKNNQCDSIYTLNLTVTPIIHKETTVKIYRDYLPYIWEEDGRACYMTDDYVRSWQTGDCINTSTLHLIVGQPDTTTLTICEGDSITWRGKKYGKEGYYSDTIRDDKGLIADVYILHLLYFYPTKIVNAQVGEVCAEAETFEIDFTYSGETPRSYNIYFDAAAKEEGFVDMLNATMIDYVGPNRRIAHVTLPHGSVVYTDSTGGKSSYVRPNRYNFRLELDNGSCGRSDTTISLIVKYPSWIIEQNWNDVVAPLKPELNGGFAFSKIDWYVNNVPQPDNAMGYLHNDQLNPGDEVYIMATRLGENYAIPSCPIIITDTITWSGNPRLDESVNVSPNHAPLHMPIVSISAQWDGQYEVYSYTGTLISTGRFAEGQTPVELPAVSGIYVIRTAGKEGNATTHKVIIY